MQNALTFCRSQRIHKVRARVYLSHVCAIDYFRNFWNGTTLCMT
jgi:hypothetical protein